MTHKFSISLDSLIKVKCLNQAVWSQSFLGCSLLACYRTSGRFSHYSTLLYVRYLEVEHFWYLLLTLTPPGMRFEFRDIDASFPHRLSPIWILYPWIPYHKVFCSLSKVSVHAVAMSWFCWITFKNYLYTCVSRLTLFQQ